MFSNGPEYEARCAQLLYSSLPVILRCHFDCAPFADTIRRLHRPFTPPTATLKQLHDAVPKHLLRGYPLKSFGYVIRDILFCVLLFWFAASIPTIARSGFGGLVHLTDPWEVNVLTGTLWVTYWWWQGLVFTSFFCIGEVICNFVEDLIGD